MITHKELRLQAKANVRWLSASIRQISATIEDLKSRSAKSNREQIETLIRRLKWLQKRLVEEQFYSQYYTPSLAPILLKD